MTYFADFVINPPRIISFFRNFVKMTERKIFFRSLFLEKKAFPDFQSRMFQSSLARHFYPSADHEDLFRPTRQLFVENQSRISREYSIIFSDFILSEYVKSGRTKRIRVIRGQHKIYDPRRVKYYLTKYLKIYLFTF